MNSFYLKLSVIVLLLLNNHFLLANSNLSTEIRAVWLTTNWQLDWPRSTTSIEDQKRELVSILDQLQQANFNTVLFQVRIRGDVFYRSQIEPISPFFLQNIRSANYIPYDPLSFAIEECHRRGLQCHAWIVTFPVGSESQVKKQGSFSIVRKQPNLAKLYKGEWYLDPGNPGTRRYLLSIVNEIVNNYDIDGIHFDYMRYPDNAKGFPDSDTYQKYGKGKTLEAWRRNNIDLLVDEIYSVIKLKKPWVQVSCSPIGKYKSLNNRGNTWSAYESVHQDAELWLQRGKMDAIYPMMYYKNPEFEKYVKDWEIRSNDRFVVPGIGVYKLDNSEGNWNASEIVSQMSTTRSSNSTGMAFYRTGNILNNTKNIKNIARSMFFQHPAKLPAMSWLKSTSPVAPANLSIYRDGEYIVIEWESTDEEQKTYTLYESYDKDIDIDDPRNILMTRIHGNKIYLKTPYEDKGIYYSVSATDRYNNESESTHPAFFILSSTMRK